MKRLILFLYMVCTLGGSLLSASDLDSLYQKGNSLYEEGKYEEALGIYYQVIGQNMESADLYYNMGNAAYRSNSIGYAILYYEKALKLEPTHEDAANNLEFVSQYRLDAFEEVPRLFMGSWISGFVHLLPERIWSVVALLLFLVVLTGILIYLFAKRMAWKKTGFLSSVAGLLLFVLALSSAASRHREIVRPDSGIILAPSVVVRSSPSESGTELFILHEGTKVEISEEVGGWQNIRVIDGREGWILAEDFDSI